YDEWSRRGSDVWACALGVPGDATPTESIKIARRRVVLATTNATTFTTTPTAAPKAVDPAVAPWSTDVAYRHTVVMTNDGRLINRIVTLENAEAGVHELVARAPLAWFKASQPKRLVIYAHGGLNDERGSLDRIRVLAPYFDANGVYPLFITWKT